MVSDGTEFAVGDIERLFDEARRNTKAKHEKWAKHYDRRRRDVEIKEEMQRRGNSDALYQWVQLQTKKRSKSGSPDQPMRGGHNKEDQFESEEAENISTAPISKSKQGQQVGRPEAELVNNSIARRGKEERTAAGPNLSRF
ncbi:hypothetical protein TNCV_2432141 [Trichonephila clavipes]|nr:hypothetical protein TNCV_2432141 [Trichonephila clavipes]